MNTQRLRQLAEQFSKAGVGGMFTAEQARELVSLAIEAADALAAPGREHTMNEDTRNTAIEADANGGRRWWRMKRGDDSQAWCIDIADMEWYWLRGWRPEYPLEAQELADLRGEQGDAMEVVPDGKYVNGNFRIDRINGHTVVAVRASRDGGGYWTGSTLPDGWKLMRPVARGEDGTL